MSGWPHSVSGRLRRPTLEAPSSGACKTCLQTCPKHRTASVSKPNLLTFELLI